MLAVIGIVIGLSIPVVTTTLASASESAVSESAVKEKKDGIPLEVAEVATVETDGYYIVMLEDAPLAAYEGTLRSFAATSPAVTGDMKLDVASEASVAYREYLLEAQSSVLAEISSTAGRAGLDVPYQYTLAFNGMAVYLTPAEALQVASIDGVAKVFPSFTRELFTDVGPEWIGAPSIWDGSATPDMGTQGEGMIVGILDTGINMDHPSFADVGDDGYDHPAPEGGYLGWCSPDDEDYDEALVCNDKLIGVYGYPTTGDVAEDDDGHGSHVAGTAAGNVVTATLAGITRTISGVAPHAHVVSYKVCGTDGCPGEAILGGIEDAIENGVDVMNLSLGADASPNPYDEPDDLALLNAVKAGIMVVAAAGNDGANGAATVGTPAGSPWVMTVANMTHNRFLSDMSVGIVGDESLQGIPATQGALDITETVSAEIFYAGELDADNFMGCNEFEADAFAGKIALISRGACAFATKEANAAAAGAVGYIVFNNVLGPGFSMGGIDDPVIPGVMVDLAAGTDLVAAIEGMTKTVEISPLSTYTIDDDAGDVMNSSSSKGPYGLDGMDVIKPDVGAPGTNIWAAEYSPEGSTEAEYGLKSGTSMASPHVAGSAALMRALFPDWTPDEVRSALMLTAYDDTTLKSDYATPTDPFDLGAGRVDLTKAAMTALVLPLDPAAYDGTNPETGGDPSTLNIASMQDGRCVGSCTFVRTVKSVSDYSVSWNATMAITDAIPASVEPVMFTLAPGETQVMTITLDVSGVAEGEYYFGKLDLTPSYPAARGEELPPMASMPIAVQPSTGSFPSAVTIQTHRDAGEMNLVGDSVEVSELELDVFGLVEPIRHPVYVTEDPTNDDIYGDLSEVVYMTVTIPSGTGRFVAEVLESESPDLDLFLGYDFNGDGVPQDWEEIASSASGTAFEYISDVLPYPGDYWILIQNWAGSSEGATDEATLGVAVMPLADYGNLDATGPTGPIAAQTDYTVTLSYDMDMEPGDVYYGLVAIGSGAASEARVPGDITITSVDLYRLADDVTKVASKETVNVGDTVAFTVTVLPNDSSGIYGEDVTYYITDTLPAGLELMPETIAASAGTPLYFGSTIGWSVTQAIPVTAPSYTITSSLTDDSCDTPFSGLSGYIDLESIVSLSTIPGIEGDTIISRLSTGAGTTYYDTEYAEPPWINDDGFIMFEATAVADFGSPWVNQDLPDETPANGLLAPYWRDMQIVYDEAANKGVTGFTTGSGLWFIEFDDIQVYGAPSQTLDFQVIVEPDPNPRAGFPDIWYVYDNVNITDTIGTIGIENVDGTAASQLAYNSMTPQDDMVVCLDLIAPLADPAVLTYQAEVTDLLAFCESVTNSAQHSVSFAGTSTEYATAELYSAMCLIPEMDEVEESMQPGEVMSTTIPMTNHSDSELSYVWVAAEGRAVDWVNIEPVSGDLAPAETVSSTITMDSTGLPAGVHEAVLDLVVTGDSGTEVARTVTVKMTVASTLAVSMSETAPQAAPTMYVALLLFVLVGTLSAVVVRRRTHQRL